MTALPRHELIAPSSGPWWALRARWIYDSILDGQLRDHDAEAAVRYPLVTESIGTLDLPGGRFAAADPYVMGPGPSVPFAQHLAGEVAEVTAVRAVVGEDHERVAALVLHVGSHPIVDWLMATDPGQDPGTLDADGYFGYAVDAGTGSFGSPDAMQVAGQVFASDAGMLDDPVSRALFADGVGTRSAVVMAPEEGAVPIAVCSSGWGDGLYPTWLGVDASGDVVVAVTDFLLTGDPHAGPPPPPAERPPPRPKSLLRRMLGG